MKSKFAIKAEVKKMRRLEKSTESNGIRASANSFALALEWVSRRVGDGLVRMVESLPTRQPESWRGIPTAPDARLTRPLVTLKLCCRSSMSDS